MEIFYERYADTTFRFADGRTLKVCHIFLAAKSTVFDQIFKESSGEKIIDVQDYDCTTFKLFMDCSMGFQECTVSDALLILPIAWKYEVQTLIKSCIGVLTPSKLNEDVCLALNVALQCHCVVLIDKLIVFLNEKNCFYQLLDEAKYFMLLEPEAMYELLNHVEMDSYILENVFKWANNYLKKKQILMDVKSFFIEYDHNIIKHLKLTCFETTNAIFKFNKSDLGKNFFTSEEFLTHIETEGYKKGESAWCKIKAGDTLIEKLIVKDVILTKNFATIIWISRNTVVCYDSFENKQSRLILISICCDLDGVETPCTEWGENSLFVKRNDTGYNFKILCKAANTHIIRNINVEIKFKFYCDCRILKSSPDNFTTPEANGKNLCFVKSVNVKHQKL